MNHPIPNYKRTIVKKTMRSSFLHEERNLYIYLPPGYQEILSYPVIYCQDGEQFFNFGRIATQATGLILEHNMQPPIIVGIEVNAKMRNADYHPLGERHQAYCSFFTDEMLPFIETSFPVRTEPDERILAGDSLGAAVSLHLALNKPKLFHKIISLSGAFYEASRQHIMVQSDLTRLHMYMVIGLQETQVRTDHGLYDFLTLNRLMKHSLEQKNVQLHYVENEGKHIWGFWQQEIPGALLHFLKA